TSRDGVTGLLFPKTASAAVNANLSSSSLLIWRVEKTLRSKNDGFEPSLSASPISCGGAADDFAERVLNSLMKGRTVRRTGPLGVYGPHDEDGQMDASIVVL